MFCHTPTCFNTPLSEDKIGEVLSMCYVFASTGNFSMCLFTSNSIIWVFSSPPDDAQPMWPPRSHTLAAPLACRIPYRTGLVHIFILGVSSPAASVPLLPLLTSWLSWLVIVQPHWISLRGFMMIHAHPTAASTVDVVPAIPSLTILVVAVATPTQNSSFVSYR